MIQCMCQTQTHPRNEPDVLTRRDSLYLAKLNTSGNLMIAGGVGLCAVGGYLVYYGVQVYNNPVASTSTNPAAGINQNHNQGTAYIIGGGAVVVGSIILGAFGVRNKIDFKQHLKYMHLQAGWLQDGGLGAALTF